MNWDYIIVGAGSAGCVLAERLSASERHNVLLLEAGGDDRHPLVHMPKGMAKLFSDPRHVWFLKTTADGDIPAETWIRGKVLGGSSSVNGMMYFRGHPQDYEDWRALGATEWGAREMWAAFDAIEKGSGTGESVGPLRLSQASRHTPLTEAIIGAAERLGIPRVPDLNHPDQEGIGYPTWTVHGGRRQSAAQAFLKPARRRRNLSVETGVTVSRILFDGQRAIGVAGLRAGRHVEYRTHGEVILSAGALCSPQILERSGIGDHTLLQALGIPVVSDKTGVGENMLEHRLLMMQYELLQPLSDNAQFRGWRLGLNTVRYLCTRSGPLAAGSYDLGGFVKTQAGIDRPDAEILIAPYSLDLTFKGSITTDTNHSMHMFGYPLRSRSRGSIHISAADPRAPPHIKPNYLTDPYDCTTTVAMFRLMRLLVRQPPVEGIIGAEIRPGSRVESDASIINAFRANGQAGYHACGTAKMGVGADAVVDTRLRVRGVTGVRVIDGSIMPLMVSANTNGPIMALAWRASYLIAEDMRR